MSNLFTDLSSNNSGFNAAAYASAGYVGVSIKATEGGGFVNPNYHDWVLAAHRHNLPVFHYHFARPENGDPIGQARHFWNVAGKHVRRPGDFLVWDLETGSPREGNAWLQEADRELIRLSGYDPWCYTFLSYFLTGRVTIRSKKIWMAAWGSNRPGTFLWNLPFGQKLIAWQFTDGQVGPTPHTAAGVPGVTDMNILNPSVARMLHKQRHPR